MADLNECQYCHFPLGQDRGSSCCYGCYLNSSLKKSSKILHVAKLGISLILSIVILFLSYYPAWVSLSPDLVTSVLIGASIIVLLLLGIPHFLFVMMPHLRSRFFGPELFLLLAVLVDTAQSFAVYFKTPDFILMDSSYKPFCLSGIVLIIHTLIAYVEAFSRKKSTLDIHNFMQRRPKMARQVDRGREIEIPITDIKVGHQIRVLAGEIIPSDGRILSGTTSVDESVFTAENTILLKKKGDRVMGASLNRDGTILIEVETDLAGQFLEQIIQRMREGLDTILKMQSVIDRIFALVVSMSFIVLMSIILIDHVAMGEKVIFRGIALLTALGFFNVVRLIPMIRILGIGKAAVHGMLFKSGELFGKIASLDSLFFDKTGTLTKGRFYYSHLLLERGTNQGTLLSLLFSLEKKCSHPIAKGVETHPWYSEIPRYEVVDFVEHAGLGIEGKVCDRVGKQRFAAVGNQRFLKRLQMQVSRQMREKIDELETMGDTVILCGWDGQVRGLMSLADTLRHDVKPLLRQLMDMNINSVMVTGDHDQMLAHLSYVDGLKEIYTRCLPGEKIKKIQNRQESGQLVGMVGDMREVDEVFSQADVGIVLGGGTGIVHRVAQVVLLGKRLLNLPQLISFCRKVDRMARFSLIIGVMLTGIIVGLSAMGYLRPVDVLFASSLVSLLLMANILRLRTVSLQTGS